MFEDTNYNVNYVYACMLASTCFGLLEADPVTFLACYRSLLDHRASMSRRSSR